MKDVENMAIRGERLENRMGSPQRAVGIVETVCTEIRTQCKPMNDMYSFNA